MAILLSLALTLLLLQGTATLTSPETFAILAGEDPSPISEPCRQHLELLGNSSSGLWTLQMLDSWAKIPSGILNGVYMDLGNYDECVSLKDIPSKAGAFNGKYCITTVAPTPATLGEAEKMVKDLKDKFPTIGNVGGVMPRSLPTTGGLSLTAGYCLPSSCTPTDFMIYLSAFFNKYTPLLQLPKLSFYTEEKVCTDGSYDDFRPIDWGAVAFLIIFAVFAVCSTAYDLLTLKSDSRKDLLLAFSWYSNGKKLFSTRKSAHDISCLHGIRFFSMAWVVMCHRYSLNSAIPSTNSIQFNKQLIKWEYLFLQGGTLSVDSFFFLSGVLVAYVFLNGVHKGARFNILLFYFHRYIRLTPALAVVIFLYVSLIKYTGSGPMWKIYAVTPCGELWWKNLLYVNNYFDVGMSCVGQSWYLAADMQLYWLSPLVLIPLWKKPKAGKALLGFFTLAGLATSFGICYHYEIITFVKTFITDDLEASQNYTNYYYYFTHTRLTPWLVGIALGYILHEIKKKPSGRITLSMVQWIALWCLAAFFMLVTLCGVFPLDQADHENNILEYTFFNTFHRPVWALGIGLMVLLCSIGYGGPVNTFLSWSFFLPLSRLTYGIFLIHPIIQSSTALILRTLIFNDDMKAICDTISDVVLSALLAIVFCLVFESPFIVLEKVLLGLFGVGRSSDKKQLHGGATKEKHSDMEAPTTKITEPEGPPFPSNVADEEAMVSNGIDKKSQEVGETVLDVSSTSNLLPH